jgi:DNA-binding transcriptional LysR family regulator
LTSPTLKFPELRERTFDLVLTRLAGPLAGDRLDDDLNVEVLFDDRMFVVAGTESPWVRRRKIDISELVDEPWILPPPNSWAGRFVAEAFRAHGLDMPRVKVVTYSGPLRDNLLPTGQFVGVLDGFQLHDLRGKGFGLKALPIDLPILANHPDPE